MLAVAAALEIPPPEGSNAFLQSFPAGRWSTKLPMYGQLEGCVDAKISNWAIGRGAKKVALTNSTKKHPAGGQCCLRGNTGRPAVGLSKTVWLESDLDGMNVGDVPAKTALRTQMKNLPSLKENPLRDCFALEGCAPRVELILRYLS